jgi:hypothetical protein
METDPPNHVLMRGLAEAIAFGRSVGAWARSQDVVEETALAWTELSEVQQLVEKCRVSHAERMVGKISGCVERAIDRLVELSEGARDTRIALAATKVIIKKLDGTRGSFCAREDISVARQACEGAESGAGGG